MSLRRGARAVIAISNVRDAEGRASGESGVDPAVSALTAAPAWADDRAYDIDDLVTEDSKVYKCINPSRAAASAAFATVAGDWKEVPANPVLPLISYNFNDSGGTTTQLFQDESDTARTITNTSAATCTISFAEVQGDSNASKVQDILRRGFTFSATIYKHGYPSVAGDLTIQFAGQVQDRTDQSGDAFTQVDVTIGVEGKVTQTRVA